MYIYIFILITKKQYKFLILNLNNKIHKHYFLYFEN